MPQPGSKSAEYSPHSHENAVHGKIKHNWPHNQYKHNYQTIEEEQESKSSKDEQKFSHGHIRNNTYVTSSGTEEGMVEQDDTGYTSNQVKKHAKKRNHEKKKQHKGHKEASLGGQYDSFTNQFDNISKVDSPDKLNSHLTYLCYNLYEILNRNQIPVKHSSEDSSHDLIIKIFETVAHDLRLK